MRDPSRIPLVLAAVERAWRKYPDLRFCQLVESMHGNFEDLFYVEDDRFLQALAREYEIELTGDEEDFVREEPARRRSGFAADLKKIDEKIEKGGGTHDV